jgi:3-hydroxy-9,10-secoandrosta-1,3,5(10)-triene-9,17-dione monooxygenase
MSMPGPVLVSSGRKVDIGVVESARALIPVLAARSAATVENRRVPDETIQDFRRAGLFRVLQPARFGGLELDFAVFATITRELARGCASSAWVYAVIEELFWVIATFPEEAQLEIWRDDPQVLACASLVPTGTAERDGDGYRLTGQWHFLSGSDHAAWVFLTAACDNGKGGRELRNFLIRRPEVQLIDDWHVIGLAGTGSKSVKVDGVYVPAHRSVRYDDVLNGTAPGARVHPQYSLLRAPRRYLTTFSITPVIVGLANRALDVTTDILRSRLNAGSVPDEFETVQQKIAECAAEAHTANLILDTHLRDSVATLEAGTAIGDNDIAKNRLLSSYMVRLSIQAIERLCSVSGSRWIYNDHPLQVILRDALAGATHRAFSWEAHARAFSQSIGIERRAAPPIGP